MFRRIYDSINPKFVFPICGVLFGLIRGAGAYVDSVKAGAEMNTPQIGGYLLGAVLVWGLAGLAVAYGFEWLERRAAGAGAKADGAEPRG